MNENTVTVLAVLLVIAPPEDKETIFGKGWRQFHYIRMLKSTPLTYEGVWNALKTRGVVDDVWWAIESFGYADVLTTELAEVEAHEANN